MNPSEMRVGIHYVVTQGSEDGTFEVGDDIYLCMDGAIVCTQGGGWIAADEVPEAMRGVQIAIDQEWVERRRAKLQEQLRELESSS